MGFCKRILWGKNSGSCTEYKSPILLPSISLLELSVSFLPSSQKSSSFPAETNHKKKKKQEKKNPFINLKKKKKKGEKSKSKHLQWDCCCLYQKVWSRRMKDLVCVGTETGTGKRKEKKRDHIGYEGKRRREGGGWLGRGVMEQCSWIPPWMIQ